jgi:peptidoglycan L-alanyl-D-glutamate endopeptidase CwlK
MATIRRRTMSMGLFDDDVLFLQRFLKCCECYDGDLDGDWGPLTDGAVSHFETQTQSIADRLGRFDPMTERHLRTLQPRAQEAARGFMRRVTDAGFQVRIISGTRTYGQQDALFAKGRTLPGNVVTKAKGGKSNHNFGIAWDIGVFDNGRYLGESPLYDRVPATGLAPGIEWGGNWTSFKDRPHYQLASTLTLARVRTSFELGSVFV